jgi:hypothetical protein
MSESNKTSGGIGFCGLLAIVFITLKLTKVIGWPWIWVLAPVWIPAAIGLAAVIICVLLVVIQAVRK